MVGGNHTQLTRLDLCLYCRGTLRAGPRRVMQSMSGVPAAALCSVVHWFALSALAATPCLYPSVRQSRVKSGQVRAKSGSTTTTLLLLLLLLYLPTYILDISPTALRCTPSGLAGQVVVARIECPLRWHAQANQTTNNVGPLRRWHVIADMPEPLLARPAPVATEWRRQ